MSTPHVIARSEDGILQLTLQRPERRNALTGEMYTALADNLAAASQDPAIRVVVIRGAGGHFTAGNDLADFMNNPPSLEGESPVLRFLMAIARFDKPLIAGVEGVAVGVGTTLLLHCDMVWAADSARFRLPFVNLGLVPEAGASLLLPRLVGRAKASELLLLGREFGAKEALEMGMINGVLAPGDLEAQLMAVAQSLAELPRGSVMASRALIRGPFQQQLETVMAEEGRLFFECLGTPEFSEAAMAFFEKRKPDFKQFG